MGAAYSSIEENILLAAMQDEAAPAGQSKKPKTDIAPGSLPCGKIGGQKRCQEPLFARQQPAGVANSRS